MLCATRSSARDATSQTHETAPKSDLGVGYALRIGVDVGARWFTYSDPLYVATNLRPYDIVGVSLFTFGGDLRPFVWTDSRILEQLAVSFDYAFAPAFDSATSDGTAISTSWDHGDLKLQLPVRLAKHALDPRLGPTLGYGWNSFSFTTSSPIGTEIPSATYRFVRIGLAGSMTFARRFALKAGFDYLGAASGGDVYDRFRDVTLNGMDARLGLSTEITAGIRVNVMFDYTRFFSSFVPIPGDAYVAGGALDQFGSIQIGIEYAR